MEGAHEVLAAGQVDRRLAADGGIHHGQQGGGYLHEVDAAHVGCSAKARQVAHHAAAAGHHEVVAAKAVLGQHLPDLCRHGDVLGGLSRRDEQVVDLVAGFLQAALDQLGVGGAHVLVADDHGLVEVLELAHDGAEHPHAAPAHADLVAAAVGKADGDDAVLAHVLLLDELVAAQGTYDLGDVAP